MKLTVKNRNLTAAHACDALIENHVLALSGRRRVDEATVELERHPDASPAFRVRVHIAVPGPDLRCEMTDHSPARAFLRAMEEVERKLSERDTRRDARSRHRSQRTAGSRLGVSR